jgi:hypothetical protein
MRCDNVTDASIVLARRCPNLRSIKVVARYFSDASLLDSWYGWHCPGLEFISLHWAPVTTAGIAALGERVPQPALRGARRLPSDARRCLLRPG